MALSFAILSKEGCYWFPDEEKKLDLNPCPLEAHTPQKSEKGRMSCFWVSRRRGQERCRPAGDVIGNVMGDSMVRAGSKHPPFEDWLRAFHLFACSLFLPAL